ncbi:hypothetical protein GCM10023081_38570 [Arthrobacter ginkgonis]|uniref:Uncharacterized protein n=1 Tax=Arthrobacter ginkgonis TaxID=1630594 RepID=A0ABP7D0X7_9MICC
MQGSRKLHEIRGGDAIVATDARGVELRGRTDVAAPHLGVLWIWETGTGTRLLLDAAEFDLDILPEPANAGSPRR